MYTIKRTAELTGVPVATLRAWERRYGAIEPARTSSGYRLYDDEALAVIGLMRDLVAEGWAPSQAALEVRSRIGAAAEPVGAAAGRHPASGSAPTSAPPAGSPSAVDTPAPAGSGVEPDVVAEQTARDFLAAASRMDDPSISAALDSAFARGSFETVVDGWLMRTLVRLGLAWEAGEVSVAAEHLASHAILRRLAAAYEATGLPQGGPRVLVGLPDGAHHELGVLAFATAARRQGLDVLYAGADLPRGEWVEAARRHRAQAAVIGVPRPKDVGSARATVTALRTAFPELKVMAGGTAQSEVGDDVLPLGHEIGPAARALAQTLRGD